jgi:hypothetical protein
VGLCGILWDTRDLFYGSVPLSVWDYVLCGVALSIGSQKADLLADPLGRVPSSCFLITCRVPLFRFVTKRSVLLYKL